MKGSDLLLYMSDIKDEYLHEASSVLTPVSNSRTRALKAAMIPVCAAAVLAVSLWLRNIIPDLGGEVTDITSESNFTETSYEIDTTRDNETTVGDTAVSVTEEQTSLITEAETTPETTPHELTDEEIYSMFSDITPDMIIRPEDNWFNPQSYWMTIHSVKLNPLCDISIIFLSGEGHDEQNTLMLNNCVNDYNAAAARIREAGADLTSKIKVRYEIYSYTQYCSFVIYTDYSVNGRDYNIARSYHYSGDGETLSLKELIALSGDGPENGRAPQLEDYLYCIINAESTFAFLKNCGYDASYVSKEEMLNGYLLAFDSESIVVRVNENSALKILYQPQYTLQNRYYLFDSNDIDAFRLEKPNSDKPVYEAYRIELERNFLTKKKITDVHRIPHINSDSSNAVIINAAIMDDFFKNKWNPITKIQSGDFWLPRAFDYSYEYTVEGDIIVLHTIYTVTDLLYGESTTEDIYYYYDSAADRRLSEAEYSAYKETGSYSELFDIEDYALENPGNEAVYDGYRIILNTNNQSNDMYNVKINLPRLDASLPGSDELNRKIVGDLLQTFSFDIVTSIEKIKSGEQSEYYAIDYYTFTAGDILGICVEFYSSDPRYIFYYPGYDYFKFYYYNLKKGCEASLDDYLSAVNIKKSDVLDIMNSNFFMMNARLGFFITSYRLGDNPAFYTEDIGGVWKRDDGTLVIYYSAKRPDKNVYGGDTVCGHFFSPGTASGNICYAYDFNTSPTLYVSEEASDRFRYTGIYFYQKDESSTYGHFVLDSVPTNFIEILPTKTVPSINVCSNGRITVTVDSFCSSDWNKTALRPYLSYKIHSPEISSAGRLRIGNIIVYLSVSELEEYFGIKEPDPFSADIGQVIYDPENGRYYSDVTLTVGEPSPSSSVTERKVRFIYDFNDNTYKISAD